MTSYLLNVLLNMAGIAQMLCGFLLVAATGLWFMASCFGCFPGTCYMTAVALASRCWRTMLVCSALLLALCFLKGL